MLPERRLDPCGVEPPQSGRNIRVVGGALEAEAFDDACQHGQHAAAARAAEADRSFMASMLLQLGLQKQIVLSFHNVYL
jgi:hypothetical protein